MKTLAITLMGSVHLMAAVVWVGGGIVLDKIVMPNTAKLDPPQAGFLNGLIGQRFGQWVVAGQAILLISGVIRSIGLGAFSPEVLFGSTYGSILLVKMALFAALIYIGARIIKAGIKMGKLAEAGASQAEIGEVAQVQKKFLAVDLVLLLVVMVLAVAMRVVGLPA